MFALGHGGGQVVSVLAFYSEDSSSNPAEVYNFSVKLLAHFFKKKCVCFIEVVCLENTEHFVCTQV